MLSKQILFAGAVTLSMSGPAVTQEYPDYIPPQSGPASPPPTTSPSEPIQFVLTYTSGMEDLYGLGLRDHFDAEVAWLNDALVRAGRLEGAELVGLRFVDYVDDYASDYRRCIGSIGNWDDLGNRLAPCEHPVIYGAIHDLKEETNNARGDLSWLQGWRAASGADLVGMSRRYIASSHAGICGVARIPEQNAHATNAISNNFFVLGTETTGPCSDPSTLAHEIGHNFGLRHDDEDDPSVGYGRGYITPAGYNTIMTAYLDPGEHHDFSNPDIDCPAVGGQRCGVQNDYDAARFLVADPYAVTAYNSLGTGMQIRSAVLPSARSISTSGSTTVTFFATVINPAASGSSASNCGVELPGARSSFTYQTSSGGTPYGTANAEFSMPAGGSQELLLSYTPPSTTLNGQALVFEFYCDNRRSAAYTPGVGVAYLTTSPTSSPTPDIIISTAVGGAHQSHNGDLQLNASTGIGEFVASAQNIGGTGTVVIEAMTPAEFLSHTTARQAQIDDSSTLDGATLEVCRTDTGPCAWSNSITASTSTFSGGITTLRVRVSNASADISNDPAINRVFLVFTESGTGRLLGATSRAVCTDGAPPAQASSPLC